MRTQLRSSGVAQAVRIGAASILSVSAIMAATSCNSEKPPGTVTATNTRTITKEASPSTPETAESPNSAEASSSSENGQGEATATPEGQYLSDSTPITSVWMEPGSVDVNGKLYARSVKQNVDKVQYPSNEVEYNLERKWEDLRASIGIGDDSPSECRVTFEVFIDGKSAYRKEIKFGASSELKVRVNHALRMKLVVSYTGTADVENYCLAAWGDARLES